MLVSTCRIVIDMQEDRQRSQITPIYLFILEPSPALVITAEDLIFTAALMPHRLATLDLSQNHMDLRILVTLTI